MAKKPNLNHVIMETAVGINPDTKEPIFEPRKFELNSDEDVAGGGMPMDPKFLVERIHTYNKDRLDRLAQAKAQKNSQEVDLLLNENVAITLGKESLMLILAQKECSGIRFYFCKNPYGRDSVAAVGVKVIKHEDGSEEGQDIGVSDKSKKLSILSGHQINLMNSEVGPPNTIKDFFDTPEKNVAFMAEMKQLFFL